MAYNKAREEKKWRLWKEAEEKILRKYGVDESTIEEIRIYDNTMWTTVSQARILTVPLLRKCRQILKKGL